MGLLPLNQIVQSVATGEAVDTVSVASSASPVQLVDLGISLGQPASALDLGVQILDQSAGGSLLNLEINGATAASAGGSDLDLDGTLAALAQALAAPPISVPQLSSLSALVNGVLDVADAGANVDLAAGLATLDVLLGVGGSALSLAAPILDPNAGAEADAGTTAAPVESVSETPSLFDQLDHAVETLGLGDLPGIDVSLGLGTGGLNTPVVDIEAGIGGGTTPLPSTDIPAATGAGSTIGSSTPTNSGSTTTTPNTNVPSVPGTGATDGTPGTGGTMVLTVPGGAIGADGTGSNGPGGWSSPTVDMDGVGLVAGGNGSDTVMGLGGNDTVYGYGGNDIVLGNQNNDRVYGGDGDDLCHGGRDDDYVNGEDGDDRIWGDFGDDTLEGGDGADTFCFTLNSGNDIILDFNHAEGDRFDFQGQTFAVADVGGNAVITLSGGGAVVLAGVTGAEFNSYGFV